MDHSIVNIRNTDTDDDIVTTNPDIVNAELSEISTSTDIVTANAEISTVHSISTSTENIAALTSRIYNFWKADNDTSHRMQTFASPAVIPCPIVDCFGYAHPPEYVCTQCRTAVCHTCREVSDKTEHVCSPDILLSLQVLEQDTVACPQCHVRIHQTEGCYQMWCTQCHATFDYKSGKVLQERIHNPHYIEWIKATTGIPIADGEEDLLSVEILRYVLYHRRQHSQAFANFVISIRGIMVFFESMLLPHMQRKLSKLYSPEAAHKHRMKFVNSAYTTDKFCNVLYKWFCDTYFLSKLFVKYTHVYDVFRRTLHEYVYDFRLPKYVQTQIMDCTQNHNLAMNALHKIYKRKVYKFYLSYKSFDLYLLSKTTNSVRSAYELMPSLKQFASRLARRSKHVCDICIEANQTCMTCPGESCGRYSVCGTCVLKLLKLNERVYACPNCKTVINYEYIIPVFGTSWHKVRFAARMQELLLETEPRLVPKSIEYEYLVDQLTNLKFFFN